MSKLVYKSVSIYALRGFHPDTRFKKIDKQGNKLEVLKPDIRNPTIQNCIRAFIWQQTAFNYPYLTTRKDLHEQSLQDRVAILSREKFELMLREGYCSLWAILEGEQAIDEFKHDFFYKECIQRYEDEDSVSLVANHISDSGYRKKFGIESHQDERYLATLLLSVPEVNSCQRILRSSFLVTQERKALYMCFPEPTFGMSYNLYPIDQSCFSMIDSILENNTNAIPYRLLLESYIHESDLFKNFLFIYTGFEALAKEYYKNNLQISAREKWGKTTWGYVHLFRDIVVSRSFTEEQKKIIYEIGALQEKYKFWDKNHEDPQVWEGKNGLYKVEHIKTQVGIIMMVLEQDFEAWNLDFGIFNILHKERNELAHKGKFLGQVSECDRNNIIKIFRKYMIKHLLLLNDEKRLGWLN
jgi:hypothetical protein